MHLYAQTNLQLFNQLNRLGYSRFEVKSVSNAYKLVVQLFTGRFRPSGKTFIAHLVGTASILAQLQTSYQLVIAGLLHAVYSHGDFGAAQTGMTKTKRQQVERIVGQDIEEYVVRYTSLKWGLESIPAVLQQLDTLDEVGRNVLLMRLANELEERLDLGILYCGDAKYQRYAERDRYLPEIAQKLGYPTLAMEFDIVFKELVEAELAATICHSTEQEYSTLVTPNSCQRKLSVFVQQTLARTLNLGQLSF